jgi:hypothetical protein
MFLLQIQSIYARHFCEEVAWKTAILQGFDATLHGAVNSCHVADYILALCQFPSGECSAQFPSFIISLCFLTDCIM